MCLIVFNWQPGQARRLTLAANRDEFYARPTRPLSRWPDDSGIHAGRDLEAGGTWLGVNEQGRFAALTNIRDPQQAPSNHSRGELPSRFLKSRQSIEDYLQQLHARAHEYGGFNLLLGDREQLWHFNSQDGLATRLQPGIYGVSNATLDTPWPKLLRLKQRFSACPPDDTERLLGLLADTEKPTDDILPDTGVGLETERLLSSVFIASGNYGTRASTVLSIDSDNSFSLVERSFGPYGAHLGEVRLAHAPIAAGQA